MLINAGGTKVI